MAKVTPQVIEAIKYVRESYPYVTMVVFNKFGEWQYMGDSFEQPTFTGEIDPGILEVAADSIESFPCIFHFEESEL
jgi:hypothetical protein